VQNVLNYEVETVLNNSNLGLESLRRTYERYLQQEQQAQIIQTNLPNFSKKVHETINRIAEISFPQTTNNPLENSFFSGTSFANSPNFLESNLIKLNTKSQPQIKIQPNSFQRKLTRGAFKSYLRQNSRKT